MRQQLAMSAGWQAAGEAARATERANDFGIVLSASLLGGATALGLAEPETVAALADFALDALRALPLLG